MKNQTKWKVFPGEIQTILYPSEKQADGIERKVAGLDESIAEQSVEFWCYVSHIDSPAGREDEARKLKAYGWSWRATGWHKEGIPLLSEAGFHKDRVAFSLHEFNCSLRALSRYAEGLPGTALPAIWSAFMSGVKHAENIAYQTKTSGVGRKSTKEAVGSALLHAWNLWRSNPKRRGEPRAKDLREYYDKIRAEHGAPAFETTRTFENRVSEWMKARRAE